MWVKFMAYHLGVGRPLVMFLFDCWPVGRPMPKTFWGCYKHHGWIDRPVTNTLAQSEVAEFSDPVSSSCWSKIEA